AKNVAEILLNKVRTEPPPPMVRRRSAPSDELVTAPLGIELGRPGGLDSHTDLTSSTDPIKRVRRKQRIAMAGGAAAISVGVAIGVLLLRGGGAGSPAPILGPATTGEASVSRSAVVGSSSAPIVSPTELP